jgi:hypothetical protein
MVINQLRNVSVLDGAGLLSILPILRESSWRQNDGLPVPHLYDGFTLRDRLLTVERNIWQAIPC